MCRIVEEEYDNTWPSTMVPQPKAINASQFAAPTRRSIRFEGSFQDYVSHPFVNAKRSYGVEIHTANKKEGGKKTTRAMEYRDPMESARSLSRPATRALDNFAASATKTSVRVVRIIHLHDR